MLRSVLRGNSASSGGGGALRGSASDGTIRDSTFHENRSIEDTLSIGWRLLDLLPRSELTRIDTELIDKYLGAEAPAAEPAAAAS